MADDALVETAEGNLKVSADEVTGSSPKSVVQRVKLAWSANGSEAHVDAGADGLLVNLGTNNDVVATLGAGTNNIGDVDVLSVVPGTGATALGKAQDSIAAATDTGVAQLFERRDTLATITPAVGDYTRGLVGPYGDQWVSLATVLSALVDSVAIGAKVGGGCNALRNLDIDETEDAVKASPGTWYGIFVVNRSSAIRYVKVYNATVANTVVGTTAPVLVLPIPGISTQAIGAAVFGALGVDFSAAITIAATTGFADNDVGAPGANDLVGTVFYA